MVSNNADTGSCRESKGLQHALKEALKLKEPWDREIEFQRKNLRRQYLQLLIVHPYSKESQDAETHLWMQTSYNFIASYKQKVAAIDKAMQISTRNGSRYGIPGPVEYRKLIQRFRQFLAEEEKFWTQLLLRLYRSFALIEAEPALITLGIMPLNNSSSANQANQHTDIGRNHYQFPPDNASAPPPPNDTAHDSQLTILSKALICLGDIARYKELYNESGGRSKAGHEESNVPARRGRGRGRGGINTPASEVSRARNYDKAQQCYEQAKTLVPDEGNASHQLAILASYQKDLFGSLVHYYRALCVREPYDTAAENLATVLNKALELWKVKLKKDRSRTSGDRANPGSVPPRIRVEIFKDKVLVLHGLWRLGVDRIDSNSPRHADSVINDFNDLISDRVLPIDMVTTVIVLSQGALWKHRMIRDTNKHQSASGASTAVVEMSIFQHVLALHWVLLECGLRELAEASNTTANHSDLAQSITATFRRTLPALRVASKWLRANLRYVLSTATAAAPQVVLKVGEVSAFWGIYANFATVLMQKFPPEKLPPLVVPLEEDIELKGFLPLRKMMLGDSNSVADRIKTPESPICAAQVHPNEEQLMRISDLISDGKALAELENGPAEFSAFQTPAWSNLASGSNQAPALAIASVAGLPERDDDALTDTSRTDDDPVGDAFRKALNGSVSEVSEVEDDEQIVWNPRESASPIGGSTTRGLPSPASRTAPITPIKSGMSPLLNMAAQAFTPMGGSPFPLPPATRGSTTTAQDLLNTVMGNTKATPNVTRPFEVTASPQAQLLFGSGTNSFSGQNSIWSMSHDQPVERMSQAPPVQTLHSRQKSLSPPSRFVQPFWSTSATQGSSQPEWPPSKGDGHQWGI